MTFYPLFTEKNSFCCPLRKNPRSTPLLPSPPPSRSSALMQLGDKNRFSTQRHSENALTYSRRQRYEK
ncbi:hypothetical protein I7I48_10685 [Histoplasma ohiense]|nr:hypothetical protein I7I48_10685 [Histoplasma ohiense (nom. inval.)]